MTERDYVGPRLAQSRQQAQMSPDELAARLRVTKAELQAMEAGKRRLSLHLIALAAHHLGTTTQWLLDVPIQDPADIVPIPKSTTPPPSPAELIALFARST